jgi:hypothetical protein
MNGRPMNTSQEVLYDLCFGAGQINPKALTYRMHRTRDWAWDICRRERVDFVAVFNEVLKMIEPLAQTNPMAVMNIAARIFHPLIDGTSWGFHFNYPPAVNAAAWPQLCQQTAFLLQELGTVLECLGAIEEDGHYDADDDTNIDKFNVQWKALAQRLEGIAAELHRRRAGTQALRQEGGRE